MLHLHILQEEEHLQTYTISAPPIPSPILAAVRKRFPVLLHFFKNGNRKFKMYLTDKINNDNIGPIKIP